MNKQKNYLCSLTQISKKLGGSGRSCISKFSFLIFSLSILLFSAGCESDEDNKIAMAQECLNELRGTDLEISAGAQVCENKLGNINNQQSNIVRCSARFLVGGVTTTKMLGAFEAYNNATANNKPGVLMGALAQNNTTDAGRTYSACVASGIPSLIYVAAMSQAGTIMTAAASSTDPVVFLDYCENNPSSCSNEVIGQSAVTLYDNYCLGDAKETPVCTDVASAIASGNGDYAAIAAALYIILQ